MAKKNILTKSKTKALMKEQKYSGNNLMPQARTSSLKKLNDIAVCLVETAAKGVQERNKKVKNKQKSIAPDDITKAANSGICF